MKFLFLGDSSTYGLGLAHPEKDAWPVLVAKHHGAEFLNESKPGASNQRILYNLVKHVDDFDRIYIVWSSIIRFTRWDPENYYEVNFTPDLEAVGYKNQYKYREFGVLHFTYWLNYLQEFKQWLQSIILVQSLLDQKKKSYVMISSLENHEAQLTGTWEEFLSAVREMEFFEVTNDDQLREHYDEIQRLAEQINVEKFINWKEYCQGHLIKDLPTTATGHPLEDGHRVLAQWAIDNEGKVS